MSYLPPPTASGQPPTHVSKQPWYKKTGVIIAGTAVLALLIGSGIGSSAKKEKKVAGPTSFSTATVTATPQPAGTKTLQPTVVRTTMKTTVNRIVATKTKTKRVIYKPPIQDSVEDGTYEVGRDIGAGRYRTPGGNDCYYSINSDANGDNIVDNGDSSGQQIADVRDGQYLELSGGCTWERS